MNSKSLNSKIIFGLKIKQLRMEQKLSFAQLSKETGMSVSYLNEIEKGKKAPKDDKVLLLANALKTTAADLKSTQLTKTLAPLGELLHSNFLNELPLELFGIELYKVVEIIANAPTKVGAFISTLVELSRNYALREESFYFAALRSYQELHHNYFEDIENEISEFVRKNNLPIDGSLSINQLASLLEKKYDYTIVENELNNYPELSSLRSVFLPKEKKLLVNQNLTEMQTAFQYGKEIGFNHLNLVARAYTSSLLRVASFEEAVSHFKATYFSVALFMNRERFIESVSTFFNRDQWSSEAFLKLAEDYRATPEMLFQRLSNVLPKFFQLNQIFIIRIIHNLNRDQFDIDKELQIGRQHHPHENGLNEHYCRRWIAISLLKNLQVLQNKGEAPKLTVGTQKSKFFKTNDEYLVITIAKAAGPTKNVSITMGILLDESTRQKINFINDPIFKNIEVNTTCERCPIEDCTERASAPVVIKQRKRRVDIETSIKKLMDQQ